MVKAIRPNCNDGITVDAVPPSRSSNCKPPATSYWWYFLFEYKDFHIFKITCSRNNWGIAIFQIVLYSIDIYYYLCCLNSNTIISLNVKKN